jgi:5-methylcytosine-specific restriction endonuclease McrA
LLSDTDTFKHHDIDHIISSKHGGQTTEDNLALACLDCNRFKGSDISSLDPVTGQLTPLFNPRSQNWSDHFTLENGRIKPLTAVGRVTERLLRPNLIDRVEVRETLARCGRYPMPRW